MVAIKSSVEIVRRYFLSVAHATGATVIAQMDAATRAMKYAAALLEENTPDHQKHWRITVIATNYTESMAVNNIA